MEPMRKKAVKVTSVQAKAVWILPILLGTAFCFYYLSLAADNVAFSDYVRLINSYLPDVGNPAKFFVPDSLHLPIKSVVLILQFILTKGERMLILFKKYRFSFRMITVRPTVLLRPMAGFIPKQITVLPSQIQILNRLKH